MSLAVVVQQLIPADAAGILFTANPLDGEREQIVGGIYYLVKIDNARFTRKVIPGDQLVLEVTQTRILRGMGKYTASASIDGDVVASCELMCSSG